MSLADIFWRESRLGQGKKVTSPDRSSVIPPSVFWPTGVNVVRAHPIRAHPIQFCGTSTRRNSQKGTLKNTLLGVGDIFVDF